jgi:hypothetical protein
MPKSRRWTMAIVAAARLMLLGLAAGLGCSTSAPRPETDATPEAPGVIASATERPRDDFSRRGIPQDDASTAPAEEPVVFFPDAGESDG